MAALFLAGVTRRLLGGGTRQPDPRGAGTRLVTTAANPGGNMEGKEVRFGIANSALYATVTTAASCGAVNAMHDSFTPIGGLVPLVNMQLGEVIFGGVGAGLYGMLVMVVLTVFIAGLMVGRTPEYLGKRIQAREVQVAMLYVLVFPAIILGLAGALGRAAAGPQGAQQRRAPRAVRDPLRLQLDHREQRQRLRRAHRLDLLLQHPVRRRDAGRPVRHDRPDGGAGRLPLRAEDRRRDGGHASRSPRRCSSCCWSA